MIIILNRKYPKLDYTIGQLIIEGKKFCETCEDADRGLTNKMPLTDIQHLKVYGATAIPKGTYTIDFTYSPKFGGKSWAKPWGGIVPLITNVPGFSGVRIHPGNCADDSLGCILVGKNTVKGGLTKSVDTYTRLFELLFTRWKAGEEIKIKIV